MFKLPKRQRRKFKKLVAVCTTFATLALASGDVRAEPVTLTIAEALMYVIGFDAAMATAAAIVSFAVSTTLSYAIGALTPSAQGGYSSRSLADRTHMIRSPVAARTLVYGRAMVSGPLVFIGVSDVRDGVDGVSGNVTAKNGFLHMVVPVAGHEIDAVEEIYLGDEAVNVASLVNGYPTAGTYANYVDTDVEATWKDTLAANATMITLPGTGANSLIVTVEDGESYTTITGDRKSVV